MPIDVTANYIRIRVANPSLFSRFRVKLLGKGIKAVIGFKKGGGSEIQSVLFPKDQYTLAQAKAWIKGHGMAVHETYLVTYIDIDPETKDLVLEETLATEKDEKVEEGINLHTIKEDVFRWLIE